MLNISVWHCQGKYHILIHAYTNRQLKDSLTIALLLFTGFYIPLQLTMSDSTLCGNFSFSIWKENSQKLFIKLKAVFWKYLGVNSFYLQFLLQGMDPWEQIFLSVQTVVIFFIFYFFCLMHVFVHLQSSLYKIQYFGDKELFSS